MPLEHKGFAIHIACDGKEIPHYSSEVLSETQIACWIPSEVGKEFVVHCEDTASKFDYAVGVYCDGRFMDGGGRRAGSNCATRGVRTSLTAVSSFVFSSVSVNEDDIDDNMLNGVDVTRIGVVEVRIFHATLVPTEKPPQFAVRSVNNIGSISELFKKGGLHQVSLGKATAVNANSVCIKSVVKSEDEHFASFLFQHRPAGLLQAMGIMPRLPSIEAKGGASPKETSQEISATVVKRGRHEDGEMRAPKRRRPSKDSFESEEVKPKIEDEADHDARLELLEENMRTMQAEIMSLRAAKTNSGRVKTERAPSPILGSAAGTVIDLTDN